MPQTIYTIGYQSLKNVAQLREIAQERAALIADIRLTAFSPNPMWCQGAMEKSLSGNYRHLNSLGNINYKHQHLGIKIKNFEAGFKFLAPFIEHSAVLLVCACRDVEHCHRRLVAEEFQVRLFSPVVHLLSGKVLQLGERLPVG